MIWNNSTVFFHGLPCKFKLFMQYLELYNIDKQLCDWIWKLICKYQNFTSFAANCTIWNYSCKKLVNTNMLNVDSKDTVSCIWFTSFRNWKHNYKYFIKSNCKIRNTICRKAKWYTQDTEIINLQMEVCLW